MDQRQLWDDVKGPHADSFIWGDDEAAAFIQTTIGTVRKNRSLRRGPIGSIPWKRFGRGMKCRPRDLAAAIVGPEEAAA